MTHPIKAPIYPTNSQKDDDNERMYLGGEMEVVTADTVRDDNCMNWNSSGENSEASCMSTSSPEQVALFNLRYENGCDLFCRSCYVSWLLETHPEDVPTDLMTGVSD